MNGLTHIWKTQDGRRMMLSEMETRHLINIVRIAISMWAQELGLEPIPRVRATVFKKHPSIPTRALLFYDTILKRVEGGEVLSDECRGIMRQIEEKIAECRDAGATRLSKPTGILKEVPK